MQQDTVAPEHDLSDRNIAPTKRAYWEGVLSDLRAVRPKVAKKSEPKPQTIIVEKMVEKIVEVEKPLRYSEKPINTQEAFNNVIAKIRANTSNKHVLDATYQLETFSAAMWAPHEDKGSTADRWKDYNLTPLERRAVELFIANLGRVVSHARFLNHCYFDRPDAPEAKIYDVVVCHLRKKLKASPYIISTDWGTGYRMDLKLP